MCVVLIARAGRLVPKASWGARRVGQGWRGSTVELHVERSLENVSSRKSFQRLVAHVARSSVGWLMGVLLTGLRWTVSALARARGLVARQLVCIVIFIPWDDRSAPFDRDYRFRVRR